MYILDRYISKKFLKNLAVGIAGAIVIFFSFDFFQIIEKVTSGKLPISGVAALALNTIPSIVSYDMMHLAALIASILTMNDLNTNLEIVALNTSGVKLKRIVLAPMILTVTLAVTLFCFTEFVSTQTFKNKKSTWQKLDGIIVSRNRSNIYYKSDDKFFRIGNVDGYNNKVSNFQMITMQEDGVSSIFNAYVGFYEDNTWTFKKVTINNILTDTIEQHEEYVLNITENIDDFLKYKIIAEDRDYGKDLSLRDVQKNISFLKAAGGNYRKFSTHVHHQRIAYPFSVIIMAIIGFALVSQYSREGKSKSITIGILIGFGYYVVVEIAKAIGLGNILPILVSAWIPNMIFGLIGVYLFSQAEK